MRCESCGFEVSAVSHMRIRDRTAAAGVLRLLQPPSDNWPALHGVLRPTEPSVWQYCLPLLEADGFRFQVGSIARVVSIGPPFHSFVLSLPFV